jgi:hypothetical protein
MRENTRARSASVTAVPEGASVKPMWMSLIWAKVRVVPRVAAVGWSPKSTGPVGAGLTNAQKPTPGEYPAGTRAHTNGPLVASV